MADLRQALEENRVKEMFGSGTACVVSPVGRILYQGEVSLVYLGWLEHHTLIQYQKILENQQISTYPSWPIFAA